MTAAVDNFATFNTSLGTPMVDAAAVTPSDGTPLTNVTRAVYVGGAGDLAVIMLNGETVTFKAVPVGTWLPIRIGTVKATGTTATNILALW